MGSALKLKGFSDRIESGHWGEHWRERRYVQVSAPDGSILEITRANEYVRIVTSDSARSTEKPFVVYCLISLAHSMRPKSKFYGSKRQPLSMSEAEVSELISILEQGDPMVDMDRRFEQERNSSSQCVDSSQAVDTINPLHPVRNNERLQLAIDEHGQFIYLEAIPGAREPDAWRQYRLCNAEDTKSLSTLDDEGYLTHRQGPAGCTLIMLANK